MSGTSPGLKTALIVGATRGLGLALVEEFCSRGWQVIATGRGSAPALEALAARANDMVTIERLDIVQTVSIDQLALRLAGQKLDLLFVNAGISIAQDDTPLTSNVDDFIAMVITNALAPLRVVESLEHLVVSDGALALMSSELASVAGNPGVCDLYSASKASLNMLTKCFTARRPADPRAILLIAPGWVRTGTGGEDAFLSIDESIPLVADTVEANLGHPGLRFIDRFNQPIAW